MSDIKYDIKSVKILLNMKDEIIARQSAEIVAKDELIRELVEAVEEILNLSNPCCNRCEGGGRLWADGRCHGQEDGQKVGTVNCPNCGGTGRMGPDFDELQQIAKSALAKAAIK